MLPSELLETTWVNRAPSNLKENCLVTAFDRVFFSWKIGSEYGRALGALGKVIGTDQITRWNDAPGRTKAEVVAAVKLVEVKIGLRSVETEGTYDPDYVPEATVPRVVSEVREKATISVLQ